MKYIDTWIIYIFFLSISVLGNLFIFFIYVLLRSYATNGCVMEEGCEVNQWLRNERGMVERGGWLH